MAILIERQALRSTERQPCPCRIDGLAQGAVGIKAPHHVAVDHADEPVRIDRQWPDLHKAAAAEPPYGRAGRIEPCLWRPWQTIKGQRGNGPGSEVRVFFCIAYRDTLVGAWIKTKTLQRVIRVQEVDPQEGVKVGQVDTRRILWQGERITQARGMEVGVGHPQVGVQPHKDLQGIVRVGMLGDTRDAAAGVVACHPLVRQADLPVGRRGRRHRAIGRRDGDRHKGVEIVFRRVIEGDRYFGQTLGIGGRAAAGQVGVREPAAVFNEQRGVRHGDHLALRRIER